MYKLKYLKYKNKYLQQKGGANEINGMFFNYSVASPYNFIYNISIKDNPSGTILATFIIENKRGVATITTSSISDTNKEKELKKDALIHFITEELTSQPSSRLMISMYQGIINGIVPQLYNNFPDMQSFLRDTYPLLVPALVPSSSPPVI